MGTGSAHTQPVSIKLNISTALKCAVTNHMKLKNFYRNNTALIIEDNERWLNIQCYLYDNRILWINTRKTEPTDDSDNEDIYEIDCEDEKCKSRLTYNRILWATQILFQQVSVDGYMKANLQGLLYLYRKARTAKNECESTYRNENGSVVTFKVKY